MANTQQKTKTKWSKRDVIFGSIGAIIILFAGWLVYERYKPAPTYPLGDSSKLEYVGEVGYGCWLFCDSNPASTYYYATDMSVEEVMGYFRRAKSRQSPRTIDNVTDFTLDTNDGQDISIYYYTNKQDKNLNTYQFKRTDRKYIVSIPSFDYEIAKKAI